MEKDKATAEGTHVETLTSLYNFHQLISKSTRLLLESNSCIDLTFTDQPNLVVNCGTHASLNSKCHHQITHFKLNLKTEYSPAYERLVWDYRKTNIESIQKSVKSVNWDTLFNNPTVNKQVSIFNETIMTIFFNFIPNKLVTFDDSKPPWMNEFIKNQIKWKHQIYKTYIKNGRKDSDYIEFQEATRSATAVDPPPFKSQRIGYQSNQKLLHHYRH